MRPVHRWILVAGVFVVLALVPMAGRAFPATDKPVSAAQLLSMIHGAGDAPYSGMVEANGRLGLPFDDHFTDLADLFGGQTRLRVWWRDSTDWRVDRLLDSGEVDLFHHGGTTVQWDYERTRLSVGTDPQIRLPRDSDFLPPRMADFLLGDAGADHFTRIPPRRIAGQDALGLRFVVDDARSTLDHVDLYADADTGTVLAVEAYTTGSIPVVSSAFTSFSADLPSAEVTRFQTPRGVDRRFEPLLDIADAADQYAPLTPPASLDGLPRSNPGGRGVGAYGDGPARILAIPLQQRDAEVLYEQLYRAGAAEKNGQQLLRAGPLGIMLTPVHHPFEFRWLLTGTVTDDTLRRAAVDLRQGTTYR